MSKITGRTDFSGQDGYEQGKSLGREPETAKVLRKTFAPTIDDPSNKKATSTVLQSDDVRIHEARSEVRGKGKS